ncbi:FtsX-like permease family protein [Dyadobacter sp. LHD-138]|uniref:ABC transporter permease n=1 Tax=Dyadobacter sp. LHD-138 TaxID=3071413 RepID=UPI0027E11F13|nr:FtsX-like permease family protein [Dyadobacter sp. LHD-138]MDQ6481960.1 FtsX-like permease family protein [Dyadobacter sp. LHD-138]
MIRHLIKLIWNKRGTHALLIIEIWASFMVLFGVLSMIVYNFTNYLEPIGFQYEQVWNLDLKNNQDTIDVGDKLKRALQRVRSYSEVASASRMSSNAPFSASQMNNSVDYNKINVLADQYYTDEAMRATLDLSVESGRWFDESDKVSKYVSIIINKKMKEGLFTGDNPLGKVIKVDDKLSYKVVGIIDKFKSHGEFSADEPGMFRMIGKDDNWNSNMMIKTKPGTDANFEARLVKDMATMLPGWGIEVSYLKDSRNNRHKITLVPVMIFLIVSGFLLTNVALGLFGILNLNIAKRRGEIGLRRAMGATEADVTTQFLGEVWVLAIFSIVLGLLFAMQFPLLGVFDVPVNTYAIAVLAAILIIFLIVTLCAWYPSRQASRIHPAVALHEE